MPTFPSAPSARWTTFETNAHDPFTLAVFALGRLTQSILYATSPHDPFVLFSIAALLAAVAFVACALRARRATKVDPIIALGAE